MNKSSKRILGYLHTALIALLGTMVACSDSSDSPPPAKSRGNAAAATVTMAAGGNGVPLLFGHAAFDLA